MNTAAHSERAITEIMGALILIAIFATALGIIGITFLSQPAPLKIPVTDVAISNESKIIRVYHAGGDPVPLSEFSLRVDDQNITFTGAGSDNIWSIGETLVAVAPQMPHKVDVVLTSPFNQLLTERILDQTSSVFPPLQAFTITASAGGGGLISPSGAVSVASGADQEFAISPGFGFAIADVQVDGVSVGPVMSYTFNSVTANHVIQATFTSSSHSIQLNAAKDGELVSGGAVEFQVTGQYSSITLGATTYPLSPGDDVEMVIGSGTTGSFYGTSSTISSFSFDGVQLIINGDDKGTGNLNNIWIDGYDQYSSTLTLDVPWQSAWTQFSVDGNTLINGVDNQRIQISGLKPSGNVINLDTTNPAAVYYSGGAIGYQLSPLRSFTISSYAGTGGSISPSGLLTVTGGADQTYLLTPSSGNVTSSLIVDGYPVDLNGQTRYTFTNIVADHTIIAGFSTNPAPSVTSITPATGARGSTVAITNLAGTGFITGATVKLNRTGQPDIPATGVIVSSATRINCTFSLVNASTGGWNVVVTNPNGLSGSLSNGFVVTSTAVKVTSITPATGNRGSSVAITSVAGTGFQTGAIVRLTRSGQPDIIATGVTVVSSTQISCTVSLVGAAAGTWDLIVTNTDGQSATLTNAFTIASPTPTLTARSPTSGNRGWPVSVTLTGTGFQPGATVKLTRAGYTDIVATNIAYVSPTQMSSSINLAGVTAGTWYLVVTNSDGKSTGTLSFTVNSPAPTIPNSPAFSPNSGARGTTVIFTMPGANIQPGVTVTLTRSSTTITAYNVVVSDPTHILCTITIPSSAATGSYTARVRNTDQLTNTRNNVFSVY